MLFKEWIKTKNLKKMDIAKLIEVDKARLTRILAGVGKPTLKQASAIVKLTKGKVTLKDLIDGYKNG